jgi:hypothetical protein
MATGTAKFLQDVDPRFKGAIAIIITAAGIFAIYKGYKWYQAKQADKDSNKVATQSGSEYDNLLRKGEKLSFPASNYTSTANYIQKALDGCERVTTEIKVIEEIGKLVKKPIDWYKLVSVFGSRDISDCGYGKTNYDLVTLLKDQLDSQLIGDTVLGKLYWNDNTLKPLSDYLSKIGITI